MADVFAHLNQLNLSLQGKGAGDIFVATGKVDAFKLKLDAWTKRIESHNFSDFPTIENYMKTCRWEVFEPTVETDIADLILIHLNVLSANMEIYFPKAALRIYKSSYGSVLPFIRHWTLKMSRRSYSTCDATTWRRQSLRQHLGVTSILENEEHNVLAKQAIGVLCIFPTTYLSEMAFSILVDIKTNKRNALKDETLDAMMRGALERKLTPDFVEIAKLHQQQESH